MRKLLLLLMICLLPFAALADDLEDLPMPPESCIYAFTGETVAEHDSETLQWRIETFKADKAVCYLTKVWMSDPGRQIGKATADWKENTMATKSIAERAPEASLFINASGYVTKVYSWIPENYPGTSKDYYNTPLGSVTVTNGEVFRCLEGVPYYGLTLNSDGLNMHIGEDPLDVLAGDPFQTWSFYVECPIILNHESILDPEWRFTNTKAMRTIIAKMDDYNYAILTVTSKGGGMTMAECVTWLIDNLNPEWAYNLDGGPSSALMYRDAEGKTKTVWKNGQKNVDIMTFSELSDEE